VFHDSESRHSFDTGVKVTQSSAFSLEERIEELAASWISEGTKDAVVIPTRTG
jgi:hypothetical protein